MFEYKENFSDSVSITESLARSGDTLHIAFSDSLNLIDSEAGEFEAHLDVSDSISVVESIAKTIRNYLVDSQSLAESISKVAVMLGLTDNITFAEEMAKNIALGKTDALGIAEAVAKALRVNKSDSQAITATEKWFLDKILSDAVTMADSSLEYDVTNEVWWGMIKWRSCCHGGL